MNKLQKRIWCTSIWLAMASLAAASEPNVAPNLECVVLYENSEGIFIDIGQEMGLQPDMAGWINVGSAPVARVEIVAVTHESSFLRLVTPRLAQVPDVGQPVTFSLDDGTVLIDPNAMLEEDEAFVPLLVPEQKDFPVSQAKNVRHGQLTIRHFFQETSDDLLDYQRTHLRTSGTVERLEGTPWSLEWSGDVSYRTGDGLADVEDFEEARWLVYRLAISRRFKDYSTLRLGRFIPRELPSVGTIDGIHGEKVVSERWRFGGIAGFKPFRDDLDFTFREPTVVPYFTYFSSDDPESQFSSTNGLLFSMYEGDTDRLALLSDQRARVGKWNIFATTEVDFDVGGQEYRDGTRLTRGNLLFSYLKEGWTPRFGADRFEKPDTEAERDLVDEIVLDAVEFFDDDTFTRAFVGANHRLSKNWTLDEEVSYTFSSIGDGVRGRVSLTRRNLFSRPGSSATISVFNILGDERDGFGGRVSGNLPMGSQFFLLQPSVSYQSVNFDDSGETFNYYDASLRGVWRKSASWNLFGGGSYSRSDGVGRSYLELGITYRW